MVPSERCVGPECRGAAPGKTQALGYAGDLDAGSRGSFLQARSLIGTRAFDGVEIAQGQAAIEQLRQAGEIDAYYAGAAKRAYAERFADQPERETPFETPSPFDGPLAPGALARVHRGRVGADVGMTAAESCGCTPREPDGRDPVSGWLIYYIGTGVLLTPSPKCVPGGGRPLSWLAQTWRNVLALAPAPAPVPARVPASPVAPPRITPGPPPPDAPPPPPKMYLCFDPRIWPGAFRPQPTPCVPPQIEYPD